MRTYGEWQAERAANEAAVARIRRFLGRPYRRERPRDQEKAAVLREIGTAEALIGPVEGEPLEDDQRVGA